MISARLKVLTVCLLASLACSVSGSAAAQSVAGESASFSSFMGEADADLAMIEPACTNCGTMVVEEVSKSGADAAPAVAFMEDETTLEFSSERPDSVSGGPDPVVSPIDDELDGLEYEVTTVDEEIKAGSTKLKRKTKVKLKVKPEKRSKFPMTDAAEACDPKKAYNKKQAGWRTLRMSAVAKKKTGKVLASKAKVVKVCVRNAPDQPKSCPLSCGEGSCQQRYAGAKWAATCVCKPGYSFDGKSCVDIDECRQGAKCPAGGACGNTAGGFECGCPSGQSKTALGCKAKSPCDSVTCKPGQVCKATSVGATCGCANAKEVLTAGACKPIPVCSAATCGIAPGVRCVDATKDSKIPAGEYQCTCPAGSFYASGKGGGKCVDINECALTGALQLCGKNPCRNIDSVGAVPAPIGATCGPERLPLAPAPTSTLNVKTKQWQ